MSEKEIEVYCDGSISGATLEDIERHTANFIGRIVVVIPELNYGLIEKFDDDLMLPNGHGNFLHAEVVAIRRAGEVCGMKGRELNRRFVIYSDNSDAIRIARLSHVKWIGPQERHLADAYLKLVVSRWGYLRRSEGKVHRRRPATPRHLELAQLLNAEHLEFRLSESPLFRMFQTEGIPRSYR